MKITLLLAQATLTTFARAKSSSESSAENLSFSVGRFHTSPLFMLDNPNPNCYETLHKTMTKVVNSGRIGTYRVRSKTQCDKDTWA